ncbi:MAG: tetratricopeptide repeat protein, partial [Pseudomonadota bacterium]|nr:tetratricopeptide repeat protein [Pseudomonadota bacterium]
IWDRFGIYVIGFAIFIILSVGGNEVLNYFNKRISERESIAFDNALTLIEKGDDSAGFDQLLKLTEGKTGYKGLAFFRLSSESLSNGNYREAIDFLKKASSEKSLTKNLRVFAKIKAGLILVDHGNISEIDILLRQVIENGGPFSFHAKEIFALALIKDGRDLEAQEIFQEILNDASAPPVLARRAEIFLR